MSVLVSKGTRSFVPVINIQGIFTSPKASFGVPTSGLLGLKMMAALIRGSVKMALPPGAACPLTASVVIAPKEWPDMPTGFMSKPAAEGMPALLVPALELIEHGRNVLHAEEEVLQAGRLLHRALDFRNRFALPNRRIAARMLEEDADIAAGRPVLAQIGRTFAGTAQPMAEEHHRGRRFLRRKVDADGQFALAGRVVDDQFQWLGSVLGRNRQRIVGNFLRLRRVGRGQKDYGKKNSISPYRGVYHQLSFSTCPSGLPVRV